jgi:hypothetical protein
MTGAADFAEVAEPWRREILAHGYRMLRRGGRRQPRSRSRDSARGPRRGSIVTAVACGTGPLAGIDGVNSAPGDAIDETFAVKVLAEVRPDLLVVTAGAIPPMRTLAGHTWETFSVNWHADVRIAFTWLRAVLSTPPAPDSRVVVVGSAAELRGSAPTPESACAAIVGLATTPRSAWASAYVLDAAGLRPMDG